MSDMKLIMESWRQYSINEQQCDEMINFINEYYGESVLTEGVIDNLKKSFSPAAIGLFLAAASVLGAPGEAIAQDAGIQLPAAAQQMDKKQAQKIIDMSEVGKELKDIFGKGGKISNLLKKKDKDANDAPDAEPEGELIGSFTSQDGTFALKQAELMAKRSGNDVRKLQADGLLGVDKFMNNDGDVTVNLYKLDTPQPTPDLKAMVKKNLENN